MPRTLAMLWLCALVAGCGTPPASPPPPGRPCTAMPCTDGLDLILRLGPEDAGVGVHRFELTLDERSVQCELAVATLGQVVDGACGDGIGIHLGARTRTVELPSPVPGAVMIGSEPVPGEYEARIEICRFPPGRDHLRAEFSARRDHPFSGSWDHPARGCSGRFPGAWDHLFSGSWDHPTS
jgi:hypothetical protein